MDLETKLEAVKGIGPATAKLYSKLSIETVEQLINHIPRRYEDYSVVHDIATLRPGNVSVKAKIKSVKGRYGRNGLHVTEAVASDETDSIHVVWFNQPYRAKSIKTTEEYFLSGKFDFGGRRLSLQNPSIELANAFPVNTSRILAVYPETKGLRSAQIRKHINFVMSSHLKIPETVPAEIITKNNLIDLYQAYKLLHAPNVITDIEKAKTRLGFDELFFLIIASLSAKNDIAGNDAPKINLDIDLTNSLLEKLSFKLTNAQRKVAWQIYQDISGSSPMNRLVEGDVGSGKTMVAAMAALMTVMNGYQVAFLAPTEILARQHAETFYELFGLVGQEHRINLLIGSMSTKQKTNVLSKLKKNSDAQLVIGTHALLQKKVEIADVGLVITDEQHRFGVNQRRHLLSGKNKMPHMLSLTATPIPRSLCLTVFGELDVSIIDEKPANRKTTVTKLININKRQDLYGQLLSDLKENNGQAFVVCPNISPNDVIKTKSVEQVHRELKTKLKGLSVELLHGKMAAEDKKSIMSNFASGKINVLVSTTVIEVGVDVPNANTMVIESAERFGLAQLHQLRGRVGRGGQQGKCYLITENTNSQRLKAIESNDDGFKLAELDLELRGAGAIYGTRQHGQLDLRIANFTDSKLIAIARSSAKQFISDPANLVQYPYIKERIRQLQSVVHLN